MNNYDINKRFLKTSLQGTIEVNIYGEDNNLKRTIKANNILTTNGLNRLADMLIDGYDYFYPRQFVSPNDDEAPTSTLKDDNNFSGGYDGEIFGVNFVEWPGRHKSTFSLNGYQNDSYFSRTDNMFKNTSNSFSQWHDSYQSNTYWTPGGEDVGFICDLGITEVEKEIFNAPNSTEYHDLQNKNLYYEDMIVQSFDEQTTYTEMTDYHWKTGDGDTYGSMIITNEDLVGVDLKVSYKWYDVPQVPIVGFAIRAGGGSWSTRTFFSSWRWSLNQGKDRTRPFFPNCNGNPNRPGWQTYYWDWPWYPIWQATSVPYTYFQNSLPWAVKNPVQLAWFGNHQQEKHIYDFQLLGLKMPKLGVHAIGLGTGTGTPTQDDTDLFTTQNKIITEKKARVGTTGLKITSHLDYDEGNETTYTEAGMFFPTDDLVYFKEDRFWSSSKDDGGSGEHYDYISGSNKILKLSPIEADDCDGLMSHAVFDQPWSKTSAERVEIVYNLNVYWS